MRRTTPLKALALFTLVIAASFTSLSAAAAAARPWLGVYTQEVTSDLRDGLDLHEDGVLVNRVVEGSPAERAGIRKGDLIVRLNARAVDSPEALASLVGSAHNGQIVAIDVVRRGEHRTLSVTLEPRPVDDGSAPEAAPAPRAMPETPDAPDVQGDDDGPNDGHARHEVRLRVQAPDDEHGTPRVFKFDGDLDKLPDEARRMIHDLHIQGLDGNGAGERHAVVNVGQRGRLGVRIESLSDDLASALGAPGHDGVLVLEVLKDTPAEHAGVRAGDVILGVNGRDVADAAELQKAVRDVDGRASLSVSRKGSRRTIEVELGASSRKGDDEGSGSLGSGRMEEPEGSGRLRARSEANDDDLRMQVEELRQQLREMRRQLEDQKDQH